MKKALTLIAVAGTAVFLAPPRPAAADNSGEIGLDTLYVYLDRRPPTPVEAPGQVLPGSGMTGKTANAHGPGRWIVLRPGRNLSVLASQHFTAGTDEFTDSARAARPGGPSSRPGPSSSLVLAYTAENLRMSFSYGSVGPAGNSAGDPAHRFTAQGGGQFSDGRYYAVSEATYNQNYPEPGPFSGKPAKGVDIAVEAGRRADDLATGFMYAYKAGNALTAAGATTPPFYIFTPGKNNKKNGDSYFDNAQAVFFYAGYDLSERLNIRGSLGFAKLRQTPAASETPGKQEDRWGFDFGATYKFLDNLVYEAHLGYSGGTDLFNEPSQQAAAGPGSPPVYQITNQLTMTF